MRFLTWCNKIDERSELLFASAKHFGIEVEPIGLGKEYRGGVSKIEWLLDWLEENEPSENVVCTDAFDCIWIRNPGDEMEEMFEHLGYYAVYAGEKWYRKRRPELQGYFDILSSVLSFSSIYRYPNCGCVCGNARTLEGILRSARYSARIHGEQTEQWHVTTEIALEGSSDNVYIDYENKLFWCCAGQWRAARKLAHIENGRLTNLKTGGQPFVLHSPIPNRSRAFLTDVARRLGVPV